MRGMGDKVEALEQLSKKKWVGENEKEVVVRGLGLEDVNGKCGFEAGLNLKVFFDVDDTNFKDLVDGKRIGQSLERRVELEERYVGY